VATQPAEHIVAASCRRSRLLGQLRVPADLSRLKLELLSSVPLYN
jgi:hypothetical protein